MDPFATFRDTQRLYDRMRQSKATKNFKHVNMKITLSPLAYCDLTVPDNVAFDDPRAIHLLELSQHPSIIALHKLDETVQCELFKAVFQGLANNRDGFPKMRSITFEVSLHAKKLIPECPNNPLDRCGITCYVRIKLEYQKLAILTDHSYAPVLISAPGNVLPNPYLSQLAKYEAHNCSLQPSLLKNWSNEHLLDPRRRMLGPLRLLVGVHSVEVERRWNFLTANNLSSMELWLHMLSRCGNHGGIAQWVIC